MESDCFSAWNAAMSPIPRRIIVNPDACNGLPIVEGTRITAQTVLEFLSVGDSIEEVLEEHPAFSREDVVACLAYSAQLMKHHFTLQAVA